MKKECFRPEKYQVGSIGKSWVIISKARSIGINVDNYIRYERIDIYDC